MKAILEIHTQKDTDIYILAASRSVCIKGAMLKKVQFIRRFYFFFFTARKQNYIIAGISHTRGDVIPRNNC